MLGVNISVGAGHPNGACQRDLRAGQRSSRVERRDGLRSGLNNYDLLDRLAEVTR